MKDSFGDAERKEYLELERALRYLAPGGVMLYIIPHYQLAHKKIRRILATYFNNMSVARFTDEKFYEHKQIVFIGQKKRHSYKEYNEQLDQALEKMVELEFTLSRIPTLKDLAERANSEPEKRWLVPTLNTKIKTFATRLINKSLIGNALGESVGLTAFINQARPKRLELTGKKTPLPLGSGQIALLLASGGTNGLNGEGDSLHILRGQETVSHITSEEKTKTGTITKIKIKREVAIKVMLPSGIIKRFM